MGPLKQAPEPVPIVAYKPSFKKDDAMRLSAGLKENLGKVCIMSSNLGTSQITNIGEMIQIFFFTHVQHIAQALFGRDPKVMRLESRVDFLDAWSFRKS